MLWSTHGFDFSLKGSLYGLLHLRELDLSNNSLHFIQYGVLEDLYFLSKLKLERNPWVCDYRWVLLLQCLQSFFFFLTNPQKSFKTECISSASTTWCTGCACTLGWNTLAWCVAPLLNILGSVWRSMCIPTTECVQRTGSTAAKIKTKQSLSSGTHRWKCKRS